MVKVGEDFDVMAWEMGQIRLGQTTEQKDLPVKDKTALDFIKKSLPNFDKLAKRHGWFEKAVNAITGFLTGKNVWRDKWKQTLHLGNTIKDAAEGLRDLARNQADKVDRGMRVDTNYLLSLRDAIKDLRRNIPLTFGKMILMGCRENMKYIDRYIPSFFPPKFVPHIKKWVSAIRTGVPVPEEVPMLGSPRTDKEQCKEHAMPFISERLTQTLRALQEAELYVGEALRKQGVTPPPGTPTEAPKSPEIYKPPVSPWAIAIPAIGGLIALLLFLKK